jgi:hypothetical protein
MMDALGLVEILQSHKKLVLSQIALYCDFLEFPWYVVIWGNFDRKGVR